MQSHSSKASVTETVLCNGNDGRIWLCIYVTVYAGFLHSQINHTYVTTTQLSPQNFYSTAHRCDCQDSQKCQKAMTPTLELKHLNPFTF